MKLGDRIDVNELDLPSDAGHAFRIVDPEPNSKTILNLIKQKSPGNPKSFVVIVSICHHFLVIVKETTRSKYLHIKLKNVSCIIPLILDYSGIIPE